MGIIIREICHEELLETAVIYVECHQQDFPFLPAPWRDKDAQAEVAECYEWLAGDLTNRMFAAFEGGVMAGYIAIARNTAEPFAYEGEIAGLFVRHRFRNRGIGLRLLAAAAVYMQELRWRRVLLYTLNRGESDSFYRRRARPC